MEKEIKIEDLKKKGIIKKDMFEFNDDFLDEETDKNESEEPECPKKK